MSLYESIDDLISALGGKPIPSMPEIRGRLIDFSAQAKALEEGDASFESDLEKAALHAEIKSLKAEVEGFKTQRDEFKAALDAVNAEFERFRADKQKGRSDAEIEDQILKALVGGERMTVEQIAKAVEITPAKAKFLLGELFQKRLAAPSNQAQYMGSGKTNPPLWHLLHDGLKRVNEREGL